MNVPWHTFSLSSTHKIGEMEICQNDIYNNTWSSYICTFKALYIY